MSRHPVLGPEPRVSDPRGGLCSLSPADSVSPGHPWGLLPGGQAEDPRWPAHTCTWRQRRGGEPTRRSGPGWAAHLHASNEGTVHPAHAGQRAALHLDLHSLEGPHRAHVRHGHL